MARRTKIYRLFPRAEGDLEGIYDYTVETWSRQQAQNYLKELFEAFQGLVSGTRVGRDARLGYGVMKLPVGSHVVFYQISEDGIDIVRVLHQAMDVSRHLKP
jgi:toxin ParE1/3/4